MQAEQLPQARQRADLDAHVRHTGETRLAGLAAAIKPGATEVLSGSMQAAATGGVPAYHVDTQRTLARHEKAFHVSVAHPDHQFPREFAQRFQGTPLTAMGDGDWYHGWNSVEYRLNILTDDAGKTRSVFDPKYLKGGDLNLDAVHAAGRDPAKMGTLLSSLDQVPAGTQALVLSPSRFHVAQVQQLANNPNVTGIYVEKPMATGLKDLAELDKVVAASTKPMYFGDHYVFASAGLFALMGKSLPHKDLVRITQDPTGRLAKALQSGQPLLKDVVDLDAKTTFQGNDNLLKERGWLEKASLGGGVMLDLQVHVSNVLHNLGYRTEQLDQVTRMVRPDDPTAPRGVFVPLKPETDLAEDLAIVSGKMQGGTHFRLETGQFTEQNANYLELRDRNGEKLRLDFETRAVQLLDKDGKVLGEAQMAGDPVLLMMHHALSCFESGEKKPLFYEEQRESIKLIEAAKAFKAA